MATYKAVGRRIDIRSKDARQAAIKQMEKTADQPNLSRTVPVTYMDVDMGEREETTAQYDGFRYDYDDNKS